MFPNVTQSFWEKGTQQSMYKLKYKVNKAYVVKNKIMNVLLEHTDFMKYLDLSCTIS